MYKIYAKCGKYITYTIDHKYEPVSMIMGTELLYNLRKSSV